MNLGVRVSSFGEVTVMMSRLMVVENVVDVVIACC